jgi:hypothetical protein
MFGLVDIYNNLHGPKKKKKRDDPLVILQGEREKDAACIFIFIFSYYFLCISASTTGRIRPSSCQTSSKAFLVLFCFPFFKYKNQSCHLSDVRDEEEENGRIKKVREREKDCW